MLSASSVSRSIRAVTWSLSVIGSRFFILCGKLWSATEGLQPKKLADLLTQLSLFARLEACSLRAFFLLMAAIYQHLAATNLIGPGTV